MSYDFNSRRLSTRPPFCILFVTQVLRPQSLLNSSIWNWIRNCQTRREPVYLAGVSTGITTSFPLLPSIEHLGFQFRTCRGSAVFLFPYCWTIARPLLPPWSCQNAMDQKKSWNWVWNCLITGTPGDFLFKGDRKVQTTKHMHTCNYRRAATESRGLWHGRLEERLSWSLSCWTNLFSPARYVLLPG